MDAYDTNSILREIYKEIKLMRMQLNEGIDSIEEEVCLIKAYAHDISHNVEKIEIGSTNIEVAIEGIDSKIESIEKLVDLVWEEML